MAQVKNPTISKQTKEVQATTNQYSSGKMLMFVHLNVAKLAVSSTSHSDVIDEQLFR